MPLHSKEKWSFLSFYGLDRSVRSISDRYELRSDITHSLMVKGIHGEFPNPTENARESRFGFKKNGMGRLWPWRCLVVPWNILHERTTEGDVDHLCSPADAKDGAPSLTEDADEGDFKGVAQRFYLSQTGSRSFPIVHGIYIISPHEEKGIHAFQN